MNERLKLKQYIIRNSWYSYNELCGINENLKRGIVWNNLYASNVLFRRTDIEKMNHIYQLYSNNETRGTVVKYSNNE